MSLTYDGRTRRGRRAGRLTGFELACQAAVACPGDHSRTVAANGGLHAGAGVAKKKGGEETLASAPHSPFKAKVSAHVRRYEAVGGRRHGAVCGVSVTSR
jgi:hypothetical protein